ncbi:MAG: hypothetical protein LIR46_10115 [Bacteroidota bacterium]|nr:hypothetical protein [Bacteroidota bacterium]
MTQKVLDYVKAWNDIPDDEDSFDLQLRAIANSALAKLNQLGVGQEVYITDENLDITFDDFFTTLDSKMVRAMSIDLVGKLSERDFDNPLTAKKGDNTNAAIKELEYRIYVKADENYV